MISSGDPNMAASLAAGMMPTNKFVRSFMTNQKNQNLYGSFLSRIASNQSGRPRQMSMFQPPTAAQIHSI
jgi:hypothetical protein